MRVRILGLCLLLLGVSLTAVGCGPTTGSTTAATPPSNKPSNAPPAPPPIPPPPK